MLGMRSAYGQLVMVIVMLLGRFNLRGVGRSRSELLTSIYEFYLIAGIDIYTTVDVLLLHIGGFCINKTDFVLASFPFMKKLILFRT
jgi:hypothetical protein